MLRFSKKYISSKANVAGLKLMSLDEACMDIPFLLFYLRIFPCFPYLFGCTRS